MTTCEKHGCPLTLLLTSSYCPRCDEEAAVNAPDGKELRFGNPHPTYDIDWYHNGTDANGSPVDDVDMALCFTAKMENVVAWVEAGFIDSTRAAQMLGGTQALAIMLDDIVERRRAIRRAQDLVGAVDGGPIVRGDIVSFSEWAPGRPADSGTTGFGVDTWVGPAWCGPGSVDFSAMSMRTREEFVRRYPESMEEYRKWLSQKL